MNQQLYEAMSGYAQVLSNPKRMEIIAILTENGEMTAGDLAKVVDVTMPNLSQHLSLMKQHGMVKNHKRSLNMFYSLTGAIHSDTLNIIKAAVISNMRHTQELLALVTG